jgi:sugar phosphate isomerase/epimerase
MMKTILFLLFGWVSAAIVAVAAERKAPGLYAFYNGTPRGDLVDEVLALKESGYAGISQLYASETGEKLAQRVALYEQAGLKVLSVYLPATAEPVKEAVVRPLANRGAMIELTVQEKIDESIVASIRKTAEMAEKLKIKVALYPHAGFSVATMPQAMDLIEKVGHPNLGVMFNLCHFLKSEKAEELEGVLEAAGDRLFAVSICGADLDGKDWGSLIQTLDKGSFPQGRLFKQLDKMAFDGPVSLQCYALKGDRRENLKKSMNAWRKLWRE